MDTTTPRNYPYPQCNPPLVEDASDIVQLANLAFTIDADVQNLFNEADNNVMSPDGCVIAATAPQAVVDGDYIVFNTLRFDNSPGSVMNSSQGIRTRIDGTYLVTFWINTTAPAANQNGKGIIALDGIGDRLAEGLGGYDAGSFAPGNNMSGSAIFRSPAGRLYRLRPQLGSSTANVTVNTAEFSVVRVGPL